MKDGRDTRHQRICLSLLVVFSLSCGNFSHTPARSPSDVVTTYLQALKRNDEKTALSCWTIKGAPVPVFKKDLAIAALKIGIIAEKRLVKDADYRIIDETKEGDVAFVIVERNFLPQNKVTRIKMRLLIDDGDWKISQWGVH